MKTYNGIYLMGNYPDEDTFVQAAVRGLEFFDFLEIGLPFSDPVADGDVISDAANMALEKGVTPDRVFRNIEKIRALVPGHKHLYVMTYANHVYFRGIDTFMKTCASSGVNGIIIPDIPRRESARFSSVADAHGIWYVQFITPESSREQVIESSKTATGFLYSISVRGITGGEAGFSDEILDNIRTAREFSKVPVVLGFGIKTVDDAMKSLHSADGFIMGTKLVDLLHKEGLDSFSTFISELSK
ncbi:MAG: tryptophan synthase subunit alpha [Spirochaetota bacterium]